MRLLPVLDAMRLAVTAAVAAVDHDGGALPDTSTLDPGGADERFALSFTRLDPTSGVRRRYEAVGHPATGSGHDAVTVRDVTHRDAAGPGERVMDAAGHELRTPLAAMRNYLHLVELDAGDRLDAASRAHLDAAVAQARSLGELATRLFDASLVRRGASLVRRERLELRGLLAQAVAEVRVAHPGTRIETHLGRGAIPLDGDPVRLRQLVGNLLVNAVVHGSSGGAVEVRARAAASSVTVLVNDRGPGLSIAARAAIFEPFSPGGARGDGLGLGLHLAHAFAAEHGGELRLEARPRGGTVARLTLPLPAEPPAVGRRPRERRR